MIRKYKDLSPKFIFMYPTLNFRNNEIGAVIGINQLKRLDKNNKLRNRNFILFLKYLDKKKYFKDYDLKGCSNYAFPIILNTNNLQIRDKFESYLLKNKIEFRRGNAGGGNQLRQPYLKKFLNKKINFMFYKNVEKVHFFGYYIGNYPTLNTKKVITIAETLNRFSFF
jgi:CDP-6-deoxy-D-xylo-4-hexulose-3-dehydrase